MSKLHKVELPIQSSSDYEYKTRKPKILFADLEVSPSLGYTWTKWQTNIIQFEKEWVLLSFSAKWAGGKHITKCLADYPGYKPGSEDDKQLVVDLWNLLDEADIVVGHNWRKFDDKKANVRFMEHGLLPPRPYKVVDTLASAKKRFSYLSNKLDDLGQKLGVGRKVKTGGFETWLGCMQGDEKAWQLMKKYNKGDVELLIKVYEKLLPWIGDHPHVGILANLEDSCRNCGSTNLQRRGFSVTATGRRQRFQCQNPTCGTWMTGKHSAFTEIR